MHQALLLVARAISLAHDRWQQGVGGRRSLSGRIDVREERVARTERRQRVYDHRLIRLEQETGDASIATGIATPRSPGAGC